MSVIQSTVHTLLERSVKKCSLLYLFLISCLLTLLMVGIIFGFARDLSDVHDTFVAAVQFASINNGHNEGTLLKIIDRPITLPLTGKTCGINRSPPRIVLSIHSNFFKGSQAA